MTTESRWQKLSALQRCLKVRPKYPAFNKAFPPHLRTPRSVPPLRISRLKLPSNGAEATYDFEYATSANGPWASFTEGGTGTVTVKSYWQP